MVECTRGFPTASEVVSRPEVGTRRGAVSVAAAVLALGALLPGAAAAQQPQDDPQITIDDVSAFLEGNDWRPLHKRGGNLSVLDEPSPEPLVCANGSAVCPDEGGTYMRDPYYRIVRLLGDSNYDFYMFSDNRLTARLRAYRDAKGGLTGKFTIFYTLGDKNALLEINSEGCRRAGEDECFEVTANAIDKTVDMTELPPNLYVWREFKSQPSRAEGFSPPVFGTSKFQEQPPGLLSAQACYDTTKMDLNAFTEKGCNRKIFAALEKGDIDFDFLSFNDKTSYVVPYGWRYVSRPQGVASMYSQMMENEAQLISSESQSVGRKTGLNLIIFDFSVMHNTSNQKRSETMYSQKLVYTKQSYLQTHYALVLDKWNAKLNPEFERAVTTASNYREGMAQAGFWTEFMNDWGTHYAYATTIGERGYVIDTITDSQIAQLHEAGITTSTGMSAGVKVPLEEFGIPGSVGMSASGENGRAKDDVSRIKNVLGKSRGESACIGGSTCSGRGASGSPPFAPVLLDLRPLSDLLAPPFFHDIDELWTLRESLAAAIAERAFEKEPPAEKPAAEFLRISGVNVVECSARIHGEGGAAFPPRTCALTKTSFRVNGQAVPQGGNSTWVTPYVKGTPIDFEADVSFSSAPVTQVMARFPYAPQPGSSVTCLEVAGGLSDTGASFVNPLDGSGGVRMPDGTTRVGLPPADPNDKTLTVAATITARVEVLSAAMLLDPAGPDSSADAAKCM